MKNKNKILQVRTIDDIKSDPNIKYDTNAGIIMIYHNHDCPLKGGFYLENTIFGKKYKADKSEDKICEHCGEELKIYVLHIDGIKNKLMSGVYVFDFMMFDPEFLSEDDFKI